MYLPKILKALDKVENGPQKKSQVTYSEKNSERKFTAEVYRDNQDKIKIKVRAVSGYDEEVLHQNLVVSIIERIPFKKGDKLALKANGLKVSQGETVPLKSETPYYQKTNEYGTTILKCSPSFIDQDYEATLKDSFSQSCEPGVPAIQYYVFEILK